MRIDRHDADYAPEMPSAGAASYLLEHLWDAGPSMLLGAGAAPLSQQELQAWQANVGVDLNPWEVRTLRALSASYLDQLLEARQPDCPSPLAPPEMTEEDRSRVSDKVQSVFRSIISSRQKRNHKAK